MGRHAEQFTVTIPLQKAIKSFHQARLALGIILGDVLQVGAHENQAGAALTPPARGKTKTFLIGKELKKNDLHYTAAERASGRAYLRRRALGQRVRIAAELRLGSAELRELNRGESESNGAGAQLGSRVVASRGVIQVVGATSL